MSHTQSVLLLQPEHLQNHQVKKVLGQASGTGNKYASLFSKARFRGSGHEVDNDNNPKRKGRDSNKKIWIILTNKDHSLEETQRKKMTMETIEMTMMRTMIPSPQALKESPCYSETIHNGPLRRQPQRS